MIMTNIELQKKLHFEKDLQNVKIITLEEFENGEFILSFLSYKDGTGMYVPFVAYDMEDFIFTPWDWQSFDDNFTAKDIETVEWRVDNTNKKGIIMNGLPRLFI